MRPIVPATRPAVGRADVLSYAADGLELPAFPFLIGRRGYYGDSMGAVGANDINIYDDAIFLLEADRMTAWNANCDPGRDRPGMANLCVGRWKYRPGIHNISKDPDLHPHYEALVQAAPVTVQRDGGVRETGYFGINIHRGGVTTTSSEGCQTIPTTQWPEVMPTIHSALSRACRNAPGHDTLLYILTSRYGQ